MRRLAVAAALALPLLARSAGFDAPGLARFDNGYARCEARFAPMKGSRDEAYLAVYRVKADAAGRARLDGLRRTSAYRKELRAAQAEAAKPPASAASSPLEQQCQALWGQVQRARSAAKG